MSESKYDTGMELRKEMLGDAYVNRSLSEATDFDRPLQKLLIENCWGEVWSRAGIPKNTRSLITIAVLAAQRASTELKVHVRGAINNGCTAEEIQEVLLHATVYCGVPAGLEAFRAAKEAIEEDA